MCAIRLGAATALVFLSLAADAAAWTLRQEVTVLDAALTATMEWEIHDAKSYCESFPPNLDRLACVFLDPDEFWIGSDGAGNTYGTLNGTDGSATYFDVQRRPAGSTLSQALLRITKRVELILGQPVKLFAAGAWTIDPVNGDLRIGLRGQCLTSACSSQGDTEEHLGVLRVSGLPSLFDIAQSYAPPAGLSLRLPVHPEGLPDGSRLDVYAGDVADLPDLSAAAPLACDVAAGAAPGALIVVPDPLPDPPLRRARFYLTAVTNGTERRAGRRSDGGVLSGRDTTGLPLCGS